MKAARPLAAVAVAAKLLSVTAGESVRLLMVTPGTRLPKLSSASTATFKAAPATAFFGWVVNNSCDAAAGEIVNGPETMLVTPVAEAVKV